MLKMKRPAAPWCCRAFWLLGLIGVALSSVGCGGGAPQEENGQVSGTVTFGDQPVADGEIVFVVKSTGFAATAAVVNGKFQMASPLAVGDYQVLVTPPPLPPPDPVNPPPLPKDPADIPKKYRSGVTSPLTATVEAGSNELTFKLAP